MTWQDLVKAYNADPGTYLMDMSQAIALSVVAKLSDPQRASGTQSDSGCDPMWDIMRADIMRMRDILDTDTYGDGADLVQWAALSLWDYTSRTRDSGGVHDITAPYAVRRPSRRVYIGMDRPDIQYTDDTSCAIVDAARAVRRQIIDTRRVKITSYDYIREVITDADAGSDGDDVIYRRLPKYIDAGGNGYRDTDVIAGSPAGLDGRPVTYTADSTTADGMAAIIANMQLTDRQYQILLYRLRGYGIRAIGNTLGVSRQCIAKHLSLIGDKARAVYPADILHAAQLRGAYDIADNIAAIFAALDTSGADDAPETREEWLARHAAEDAAAASRRKAAQDVIGNSPRVQLVLARAEARARLAEMQQQDAAAASRRDAADNLAASIARTAAASRRKAAQWYIDNGIDVPSQYMQSDNDLSDCYRSIIYG